jgi:hypothetical protein
MVRCHSYFTAVYTDTFKLEPDFYEAQAVVLSNMSQHKQALEIYVFKMKDYQKAEQ